LTKNQTITNVLLVANIFVWYLIAFNLSEMGEAGTNLLLIVAANSGAIAGSALIASLTFRNHEKDDQFLKSWISIGVIVSLIPLLLNTADFNSMLIISVVFGTYFGFGMPKTLANYSSSVGNGKRAKVSGMTFLIIGLLSAVLGVLVLNNVIFTCIILAAIRLTALGSFHFLSKKVEPLQGDSLEKTAIFPIRKTFILYFIPWAIFCLVNYLTVPVINNFFQTDTNFVSTSYAIENVVIAMSAVVGGILADRLGRKRLIMFGFVMLGMGFAALGLFAPILSFQITAGYIYTVSDGVAWGIFYVMFLLTLWGDLGRSRRSELLYAIGALPYIFGNVFRLAFQSPLAFIPSTQIFSFASIFLFIAVLPLLYAPETLSDKIIMSQDLKSYVNKALEKTKKENGKNQSNHIKIKPGEIQGAKEEDEDLSPENVEARKLAEKYY
jgi:MFS family permease